jgi:hypothetical protein
VKVAAIFFYFLDPLLKNLDMSNKQDDENEDEV